MSSARRIFNFSAGPAILPVPVLEEAREHLMALPGVGMSVLEISHRSSHFDQILHEAERSLRELAAIPESYHVLFLQGGASLQFAMVPLNLLPPGGHADYVVTGIWSRKAVAEAEQVGKVKTAASTEDQGFSRIPSASELTLSPDAAYVHMTSNNTVVGTQWPSPPNVGEVPLVCDMSSDYFGRPMQVSRYGLVYGGAQKNLGPAGVTVVIVREDLLHRSLRALPAVLDYARIAEHGSRYNTPPVFGIYMIGLVANWLRSVGGLTEIARANERKARQLYAEIDRTGFYRAVAVPESRSVMNVTFRLPKPSLEQRFVDEAAAAGLDGLKGHRAVGGLRASLYNAMPEAGIDTLVMFMREFERVHG